MSKPRPLGKIQSRVLDALKRNRSYYPGCSWYWEGHRTTVRYLDQLVKRGLVVAEPYSYLHAIFKTPVTVTRYLPVKKI